MKTRTFLGFAGPSILAMVGLMLVPLGMTVWLGFHTVTFRGEFRWVGLDQYWTTLEDPDFWRALEFTLVLCAVTIPMKIGLGFAAALALNTLAPGWRGIFICAGLLPFIVTPVVGSLAYSWLFRDFGFVTWLLGELGIRIFWLSSEFWSRLLVILHHIWSGAPFAMIVLFAGLQGVPQDAKEAAIVDGAGWWDRMRVITLPHLRPLFVFLGLMMVMDTYRIFDSVAILTKGLNGTESVMWYNYRVAIIDNAVARGSAISVLTVFGILVLLAPFLWLTWKEQREVKGGH